jgi:molecular chaperone HtpG
MADEPLFHIHLNVDYPFNLTGVLYFPKIKSNIDIQKNKIQLYCNQVFVTDSVEGIVPEFLTLLHGVIDSPDIPLNVSRSYLQSDSNVKKISSHITKKVADRLQEIFTNDRPAFEAKWDDLKLFIEYGMISDEKFYEKAEKFALLKNSDGKYFTLEEYAKLVKESQTDKNGSVIYLYTHSLDEQYAFIDAAKSKGYDVLLMNGQLDSHFINQMEQKLEKTRFVRVDSDVPDKLIQKDDVKESKLKAEQKEELKDVFAALVPEKQHFTVVLEDLSDNSSPVIITQNEFMRRMKDMSGISGGMGFYGNLPDSYTLVVNANHPLVTKISEEMEKTVGKEIATVSAELKPVETEHTEMEKTNSSKKPDEVPQADKDKQNELQSRIDELKGRKSEILRNYGRGNDKVKQLIDLALLSNNMLKGEELSRFLKRSVDLIQ